jgi:hypothetical protein
MQSTKKVDPMSQEFDEYMAAKARRDAATATVNRLIENLRKFAEPLIQNWQNCYVEMFGQPTPMGLSNRRAVDANDLPPVVDIRSAIIDQFNAERAATEAWAKLSQQEQKELQPPSWLRSR